ncbi:hypothetical protein T01_6877 [Trichinella spiralis]|uniref:Uncharacterized protein n=1 Tax=Trichinella spiralis TaxID=6334 RepID=A0A0V1ATZ0_TRISP|nr:hypothetical protein T01_6877 [Trichinella spiralis]
MFTMKSFHFYLKAGPSYLVTQFIAMKARCQISIFPSSDMKQRDCGKANISCPTQLLTDCSLSFTDGKRVLRSYLVAPFSAMSTGVTWSTIIPLFYTLYEEASSKSHSILKPNTECNLSPCRVLIHTVLFACVVRQHNGKKEWMPFFLCRLPPESVPIPELVVVVLLLL